jgi:hypothetical protein
MIRSGLDPCCKKDGHRDSFLLRIESLPTVCTGTEKRGFFFNFLLVPVPVAACKKDRENAFFPFNSLPVSVKVQYEHVKKTEKRPFTFNDTRI